MNIGEHLEEGRIVTVHYTLLPDGDPTPNVDAPGWPLVETVDGLHGQLGTLGAGRRNTRHQQKTTT